MLDDNIKTQLQGYLQRLQRDIELVVAYDDSQAGRDLRALVSDIVACAPGRIAVREVADVERKPSFGIAAKGEEPRIVFAGLPLGHEFTSLVLALLQVGGHPPKVDAAVLEQVRALPNEARYEVYMSLSCHNCPDVVQALNLMAAVNPRVKCTVVDGALFPQEVAARDILAVPTVYANGKPFAAGRMSIEELLTKVDPGSAARDVARLTAQAPYDVLVLGGGPAGAAAAVYAARKGVRTGVLAERFGGQTNDTLGIENYISVLETSGPKFAADLQAHATHYGVDLMMQQRIVELSPAPSPDGFAEVRTESGAVLKARSVIVATGARWRNVNVPGEAEYKNKGVAYCPHCDGPLFKGKRVAVIGGGNSGIEAAIDLAGLVAHVTVLEYGEHLKADAVLVAKLKSLPNVRVLTAVQTKAIVGDGQRVTGLDYVDRSSGQAHRIDLQGVFVQIGLVPNTEFLRGALELSSGGEIVVDTRGRTSAPGVFAAGDATTVPFKQIVIAAGEGAKAALSAFDHLVRAPVAV